MEPSFKALDSGTADFTCGNDLTAVLVPLTGREVDQLDFLFFLWGLFAINSEVAGSESPADVQLIVSLDGEHSQKLQADINQSFEHYGLHRIFSGVSVYFCEMTPEENIYVRMGQEPPAHVPPLGLKSGPNTQFFRSLSRFCEGQKTVLLNEVDCFPVRSDWLQRLKLLVSGSEAFWVMGSPYRGSGKLGPKILAHVNGNALYGVGMPGFADFLLEWETTLREELKQSPDLAYDEYLPYRHSALFDPQQWPTAPLSMFRLIQTLLCRVKYTSLIHNLAGTEEMSGRAIIDVQAYTDEYSEVTLMHGRFLRPQILQKVISETGLLLGVSAQACHALRSYLLPAAKRLLVRNNVVTAKQVVGFLR